MNGNYYSMQFLKRMTHLSSKLELSQEEREQYVEHLEYGAELAYQEELNRIQMNRNSMQFEEAKRADANCKICLTQTKSHNFILCDLILYLCQLPKQFNIISSARHVIVPYL
jgi:hypothetical protein